MKYSRPNFTITRAEASLLHVPCGDTYPIEDTTFLKDVIQIAASRVARDSIARLEAELANGKGFEQACHDFPYDKTPTDSLMAMGLLIKNVANVEDSNNEAAGLVR